MLKTGYVNDGQVDGIFALQGSKVFLKANEGFDCRFTITFGKGSLVITDDNLKCGGLNVSFNGRYRRIGPSHQVHERLKRANALLGELYRHLRIAQEATLVLHQQQPGAPVY